MSTQQQQWWQLWGSCPAAGVTAARWGAARRERSKGPRLQLYPRLHAPLWSATEKKGSAEESGLAKQSNPEHDTGYFIELLLNLLAFKWI